MKLLPAPGSRANGSAILSFVQAGRPEPSFENTHILHTPTGSRRPIYGYADIFQKQR